MVATLFTLTTLALVQQTDTQVAVRPGMRLDLSNFAGAIAVKAWAENAVRVRAEYSSEGYVELTLEPSALLVKASSRGGPPPSVDYRINAPAWMALDLSGVNTDITIDGAQAPVTAETVNGEVKCRGGAGNISLRSVQGAVGLADAKGHVEVSTVNDDVTLSGVSGDVTAQTVSGDLELRAIDSPNVDVSTVSGSVTYEGTIQDGGHYRFATHNGDVTLGVPDKANATVSVATFNGDFDSSFPISLTGTTKHRFTFTIGSGTARIELETFNGDIKLRRATELRGEHDHEHHEHHEHEEDH